jgi:hypothetical protein
MIMKPHPFYFYPWLLFATSSAIAQGTFIYDQQSTTNESIQPFGVGAVIQNVSPGGGQSFTASLNGVDFIRLMVLDANLSNGLGATLYVNLRTNSITGPILGSTASVTFPDNFNGTANFFFTNTVFLSSGTLYYFEPVVRSGDLWRNMAGEYNYPGGTAFALGTASPGSDLWFREGLVPEPSSLLLLLLGGAVFFAARRRRRPPP